MQTWVFVLVVCVTNDGVWRDWNSYPRKIECEEIIPVLTKHREDAIQARCEARLVSTKENIREK